MESTTFSSVQPGNSSASSSCNRSGYKPVRGDAADDRRDRAAAQRRLHATATAAHVVARKRLGQCHIGAGVEAGQQFAALILQIALHRVAPARPRVLVALGIVGEPGVQFDLAPIRQMREASRDLHAEVRRTAGAVVVTVAPVRVGLDRRDLRALGADLIGGGACPDRQHQRRTHRVGMADDPLQRPGAAHRAADHRGDLRDAQRGERGNVGLDLVTHGYQGKP